MKRRANNRLSSPSLADVFADQIGHLAKSHSLFTVENYRNVYRSVCEFVGAGADKFSLEDITGTWLNTYIMYMQEGRNLCAGSVDNYCRILRAVYNKALEMYSISSGTEYPFTGIHIFVPDTLKRSLAKEDILGIINLDLSIREELREARDLFLFLFYARGMCFVDVFNLRYESVGSGYISYRRSKTSAPLQVKIVDEMQEIMERYREEGSKYVFPFLRRNRYTGKDISEKSALKRINRQLGKIGEMLGLKLTTYVARHSWASLVEECGMSIAIISQGMGHGSERVTKTYMRGMPSHVIDDANEEMLDRLIRRKKKEEEKKCPILCKNETSEIYILEPLVFKGFPAANVHVII